MVLPSESPFKYHEEVWYYLQPMIPHLNVLTFSPLTGGCSEGLGAFRDIIRKPTRNASEIRPGKTRIYKSYLHMKGGRVECRSKNAQGNYTPFTYVWTSRKASSRLLKVVSTNS